MGFRWECGGNVVGIRWVPGAGRMRCAGAGSSTPSSGAQTQRIRPRFRSMMDWDRVSAFISGAWQSIHFMKGPPWGGLKNKYHCEVIHGDVSVNKRTDIFNKFQTEDKPQVLIIQPQAASHGVTLHAANVVVYWSAVMSVETYLQANARVHRAGQKNPCTVVHLQGSAVEKRMYKMLQSKIAAVRLKTYP